MLYYPASSDFSFSRFQFLRFSVSQWTKDKGQRTQDKTMNNRQSPKSFFCLEICLWLEIFFASSLFSALFFALWFYFAQNVVFTERKKKQFTSSFLLTIYKGCSFKEFKLILVTCRYYRLLQVTTCFYRLLQATKGYCRVLQVTTGYNRLFQVTKGYYGLLRVTTGYYKHAY